MDDYDLLPFRRAIHTFRRTYNITEPIVAPMVPVLRRTRLPNQGNYWRVERQVSIPPEDVIRAFPHAGRTLLQTLPARQ